MAVHRCSYLSILHIFQFYSQQQCYSNCEKNINSLLSTAVSMKALYLWCEFKTITLSGSVARFEQNFKNTVHLTGGGGGGGHAHSFLAIALQQLKL